MQGIGKVVAVASAQGGLGTTTVSVDLAPAPPTARNAVGVLDADVYGSTVRAMLGVHPTSRRMPFRIESKSGVAVSSIPLYSRPHTPTESWW